MVESGMGLEGWVCKWRAGVASWPEAGRSTIQSRELVTRGQIKTLHLVPIQGLCKSWCRAISPENRAWGRRVEGSELILWASWHSITGSPGILAGGFVGLMFGSAIPPLRYFFTMPTAPQLSWEEKLRRWRGLVARPQLLNIFLYFKPRRQVWLEFQTYRNVFCLLPKGIDILQNLSVRYV